MAVCRGNFFTNTEYIVKVSNPDFLDLSIYAIIFWVIDRLSALLYRTEDLSVA